MHCRVLPAVTLTFAVFSLAGLGEAGELSSWRTIGQADCCPTCASPAECIVTNPDCASPTACIPRPNCCTPNVPMYDSVTNYHPEACEEIGCDGYAVDSNEGCVKRGFKKLMELERRKNRCLIDTFFGWRHEDTHSCHNMDCVPNYYYQSQRATPGSCR